VHQLIQKSDKFVVRIAAIFCAELAPKRVERKIHFFCKILMSEIAVFI
jgi:hypothetical protein